MIRPLMRRAAPALLAVLFAACARPVQIGSEAGPVYAVEIVNSHGEDMIVSYDAGSGDRTLGTVPAGGTERFIITAPDRTSITIRGRNAAGDRSAGPYDVTLARGDTPRVTLR